MGWKNVKEHFGIEHIVHIQNGLLCIGSPYLLELIQIDMDGHIVKQSESLFSDVVKDLQERLKADPAKVRELLQTPDTFKRSIPVWTYDIFDGGGLLEKQCEGIGWPNVTHDGKLMFENEFFECKEEAIRKGYEESKYFLEHTLTKRLTQAKEELQKAKEQYERQEKVFAKLKELKRGL